MILLLLVQLTLPGIVHQGDRVFFHDARSCALGGITLVLEHSPNPATMGLIQHPSVFVSGGITFFNEKRGLRVYDSYGNNIGISTVTNTSSALASPSACSFVFPFHFLRTGVQFSPVWDYNYSFYREFRDDFYQITRILDQQFSGHTYGVSPMIGISYSWIHAGVMQRFMYGIKNFKEVINYTNGPDSVTTSECDLNGTSTQCGIMLSPGIHIRLSYMYQVSYILENNATMVNDTFPESHGIGFMYQPPGRIPTRFFGQVQYEPWDDPLFLYKVGVEHTLLNTYVLRYGFCLYPDYAQTSIWTTVLTIGFGIQHEHFLVDIGYAYGKRDYATANYSTLGDTENLLFDESMSNLALTFTARL